MPVIKKKSTLEMIDNSVSFKNKIKYNKKVLLPNTTCDFYLVKNFKKEAQQRKWKMSTLMNEILKERYGKENNNNEDD
ncbi:hypothetical protein C6B38_08765 [Spiroplasma sp. ChiS]|uniref:hypothetical protein n=1 Tax=Spiroplasma sp. ChiS TaxID=2099885 RepID=UPI000CF84A2F|nr:hypothetical protein [Spiroplasma sp. ChiS]PQP78019.1 hypothetical protein C6B38_08765 [Spiroplasma sp. ChiS]